MDANNLTAREIFEGLLIAFFAIAGVISLESGHTLIGLTILIPMVLFSMLEIWKIPNKTLKEIQEKQRKTTIGKIGLFAELVTIVGIVIYVFQWVVK